MTALIMSGALTALAFVIILAYRDEAAANFKAAKVAIEVNSVLRANNLALEDAVKILRDSVDRETLARKAAEKGLDDLMDEVIKHSDAPKILVESINAKLARLRAQSQG